MFSIKAIMGRDPSRVIQEGEVHTISYNYIKRLASSFNPNPLALTMSEIAVARSVRCEDNSALIEKGAIHV